MVTFEEMLEMAASGAGVLQLRSVEYARNHGVRIHCRSSFHDRPGTVVVGDDETVEQPLITAVTHSTGEARVTLPGRARHARHRRAHLHDARRRERQRRHDHPERAGGPGAQRRGVVHRPARRPRAARAPRSSRSSHEVGIGEVVDRRDDGQGLDRRGGDEDRTPASPRRSSRRSAQEGINIEMISTSPIKISCVIDGRQAASRRSARCTAPSSCPARTRCGPSSPFGEFAR